MSSVIFLLGFMGSGKTKLGRRLAKVLKYDFIDLDKLIQEKEGKTINELFETRGEEYFRQKESEYLQGLHVSKMVVAVGGGAPCYHNNMNWMLQHGKCVWIKVSEVELFQRLNDKREKRPLLKNLTNEGLREFIQKKLEERSKYYSLAHLVLQSDGLKENTVAEKIAQLK